MIISVNETKSFRSIQTASMEQETWVTSSNKTTRVILETISSKVENVTPLSNAVKFCTIIDNLKSGGVFTLFNSLELNDQCKELLGFSENHQQRVSLIHRLKQSYPVIAQQLREINHYQGFITKLFLNIYRDDEIDFLNVSPEEMKSQIETYYAVNIEDEQVYLELICDHKSPNELAIMYIAHFLLDLREFQARETLLSLGQKRKASEEVTDDHLPPLEEIERPKTLLDFKEMIQSRLTHPEHRSAEAFLLSIEALRRLDSMKSEPEEKEFRVYFEYIKQKCAPSSFL